MIKDRKLRVGGEDEGERLDGFLVGKLPTSRSLAVEAIEKKWLMVNGRWSKKGARLKEGDEVEIKRLHEISDWKAQPNPKIKIPIIHEEKAFLVIDKPAGLPVHPLRPEETDTVVNGLLAKYPELEGIGPDPLFPAVAHRLDTETSGVMLVARTPEVYDYFRRQFKERKVTKKYVAVVCGEVRRSGRLEDYLAHSKSGPHRMQVVERESGREPRPFPAVTEYEIRKTGKRRTVLDVTIRTGVTHQIRCQLAHIGHPVAGDKLYGSKDQRGRLMLHAEEIRFRDPVTNRERIFEAAIPREIVQSLKST